MAGEHPPTLPEEITSPTAAHAQPSVTHAQPPQTPVAIPSALPPIVQSSSNPVDSVRITILEWMVNQLAANMATNMNELTALLRDQNQASSSYTPPPKNRQTMDLNPVVALTLVSESEEASFAVMTHVPAVYPIKPVSPGPNFNLIVQNQSLHCKHHLGAPDHTLDNCWKFRERIQDMIDAKQISFNEVKSPNVHVNPLPDHGSSSGPSINMISIVAIREEDDVQETPVPFVIDYALVEIAAAYASFVIEVLTNEPFMDRRVLKNYRGEVTNTEQEMRAMGITRSGRVNQGPEPADKGKTPTAAFSAIPEVVPPHAKKVTEQEAKAFMKVIKASEYKVVEQMGKSLAHISLLALFQSFEPHRDALLKVLTNAQVPKDTAPNRIEETVNSIFSIRSPLPKMSFHLKMNVDISRIRASKTTVRAFDGSRSEVNGEIDLLIDIHAAGAVPSSLHQKLKFFVEGKLITVNGEEDYAVSKETAVPYISIGEDQNLPFHSFDTISTIRDYGEVGPSLADCLIGKLLLKNDYVPGTELGAYAVEAFLALPTIYAVTKKTSSGVDIRPTRKDDELTNWTALPLYSAMVADMANPKDNFPLPHIDVLVDNTAHHTQFSFMDGFSGYNQVQMAEEDKVKTTFITMWGTFCYKVMPFGLKNAGATYQRAMVTLFHDMIHKEIEVYVDDMIAKSKEREDHLVNLK
ncbi:hypothetical protein CRG98_023140 [Punica granatum]|uniref:Reverse transcriptase domain-containing protein n=1 Tax=Punica granatum TaxID=22663 RepID=A0A2I0JJS3_PUNGR|nr:hypothetical protein CRG98_023140 [Punica granatum]